MENFYLSGDNSTILMMNNELWGRCKAIRALNINLSLLYVGEYIAITDDTGAVAANFSYTPFGEVIDSTILQPVCDIQLGFAGQFGVLREPNGLYYMNARYYDPSIGRFLSEDPAGLSGGDLTLYSYAGNNPWVFVDPSGLCRVSSGTSSNQIAQYLYTASDALKGASSTMGAIAAGGAVLSIVQPEVLPIAGTAGSISLFTFGSSQILGAAADFLSYPDPTIPILKRAAVLGPVYFMSKTSSGTIPETLAKGLLGSILKPMIPQPAQ